MVFLFAAGKHLFFFSGADHFPSGTRPTPLHRAQSMDFRTQPLPLHTLQLSLTVVYRGSLAYECPYTFLTQVIPPRLVLTE